MSASLLDLVPSSLTASSANRSAATQARAMRRYVRSEMTWDEAMAALDRGGYGSTLISRLVKPGRSANMKDELASSVLNLIRSGFRGFAHVDGRAVDFSNPKLYPAVRIWAKNLGLWVLEHGPNGNPDHLHVEMRLSWDPSHAGQSQHPSIPRLTELLQDVTKTRASAIASTVQPRVTEPSPLRASLARGMRALDVETSASLRNRLAPLRTEAVLLVNAGLSQAGFVTQSADRSELDLIRRSSARIATRSELLRSQSLMNRVLDDSTYARVVQSTLRPTIDIQASLRFQL